MLVKEIAALAAANMGRDDLIAAIRSLAGEPTGELDSLLRCYNLVENEIALDYFPLRKEETFAVADGKIAYAQFSFAPVDVKRVTDADGTPVPFDVYPEYVAVAGGTVSVTYTYVPPEKKWEEESEFSGKISARLMSFGVACEFCLSRGMFPQAAMWEKKYRDALRAANVVRRKLSVRSRRWV